MIKKCKIKLTVILCLLFFLLTQKVFSQSGDSSQKITDTRLNDSIVILTPGQLNQTGEIAKSFSGKKDIVLVPSPKKKLYNMHIKIENNDKFYSFPTGESHAVLIQLPEYNQPYILTIRSVPHGFTSKVLLYSPRGVFFDSSFHFTQELSDTSFLFMDLKTVSLFLTLPARLETEILIDEKRKTDKYLLIYSLNKNEKLGNWVNRYSYNQGLLVGALAELIKHPIVTTPNGKLEIEVKLK